MRDSHSIHSIIEDSIKFCSSILLRDSIEILKLRSSGSSSWEEFCLRSILKFYKVLYSKLKIFHLDYSFIFLGNSPKIEALNEIDQNKRKRFIINVDGYSIYSTGLPNYSISICSEEKNDADKFETNFAYIFSPCDNRLFYGEKEKGLFLNKVKFKRSNIVRNYSILATSRDLCEKYSHYQNLVYLKNFNLGFAYLATGSFDLFLTKIIDKKEALAGLFISQICAIPTKIKQGEKFSIIESGFYL